MIPASITGAISALATSITAAAPLAAAPRTVLGAIQTEAGSLVASVDAAVLGAAGALDGPDPLGMPAVIVSELTALAVAAVDQSDLSTIRGYVGRVATNLNQVTP